MTDWLVVAGMLAVSEYLLFLGFLFLGELGINKEHGSLEFSVGVVNWLNNSSVL